MTGGLLDNVESIIEIIFLELIIFLNKFLINDDFLGIKFLKLFNIFREIERLIISIGLDLLDAIFAIILSISYVFF